MKIHNLPTGENLFNFVEPFIKRKYRPTNIISFIWDYDHDTGIEAEQNADENILRFRTVGVEAMQIGADQTIGIGVAALNNMHIHTRNNVLNIAGADYYEFNCGATKVAGASTFLDAMFGNFTFMEMNQVGGEIGNLYGCYFEGELDNGNIGNALNPRSLWGGNLRADLNGGEIFGDAYGGQSFVDQEAANTVGGNIYGHRIWVDADGVVIGNVYMLYLDEQSNVDYGIYQNGTAENYLQGRTGVGMDPIADICQIGDGANYSEFEADGSLTFVNTAGLPFGEIWVRGNAVATAIAFVNVFVQYLGFANNGQFNNCTPDQAQDHIVIDREGRYLVTVSLCVESVGGGAQVFEFEIRTNNGTVIYNNLHAHRRVAGGGVDIGSVSMSGIADLSLNDTVELWVANNTNANNILVEDCNLSVVQIGGT